VKGERVRAKGKGGRGRGGRGGERREGREGGGEPPKKTHNKIVYN